jgi:hypothetical protein
MTGRPILFSGPMVRAILSGAKTQTRRVVKWPTWAGDLDRAAYAINRSPERALAYMVDGAPRHVFRCPYGAPGDTLWVREAHALLDGLAPDGCVVAFRATCEGSAFDFAGGDGIHRIEVGCWSPSIHMPRWASRISLRVTDVRVERVQDISEEDARAEGVKASDAAIVFQNDADGRPRLNWELPGTARGAFACLWDSLAKPGSMWNDNPWTWAISFERVEATR